MKLPLSNKILQGIDFFINQTPGYFILKDLNSVYLRSCIKFANLLGFDDMQDIAGLTDYSVPHAVCEYGKLFVSQDEKLKLLNQPIDGFFSIHYDGLLRPYFFNKYFLKNEQGSIVGIIAHCTEINNRKLAEHVIKLSKIDPASSYGSHKQASNYFLNGHFSGVNLSNRQSQCLFYLLRGKPAPEIAKILKLSTRTVEHYIDIIKDKMLCNTKSELIDKAIQRGYIEIVPNGIIL